MLFWPTITEPSSRDAEMWCEKFELMAGMTRTRSEDTPQTLPKRYIALSKLPVKRRAPVRNRLPTLAAVKSNVDVGGRARFKISRFR
jgi:hypothetical protein